MRGILNFRIVFRVLNINLIIISIALLLSAVIALIYSESVFPFLWSSIISLSIALIIYMATGEKKEKEIVYKREAYMAVTLTWTTIGIIGSLPFLFSNAIPSFIQALFESVSGFTTTGSSILTDIEILPKSILFWRSLTHWIGGIGIIVLFIIVMPALQIGGYNLFTLESSLQEKIQPKIKSVGYRLLSIYLILTTAEIIFLLIGRMSLFESVCHAFGTIATGGFSPKNTSIAGYSPYIQYVIMVFMFLGGTNFVIHYFLLKNQFHKIKLNDEVRYYYGVIGIVGLILTFSIFFIMKKPFEVSFREAFFQVISIITCTGYATSDYMQWPVFAWLIIFFAMFLGGSSGSTAGGIKMVRHLLLIKNLGRFFKESFHPRAVFPIKLNGNKLSETTNKTILTYFSTYLIVFLAGTIILCLTGLDGKTAASSAATAMAGIGPGIGTVGPASNFAHLSDVAKLTMSVLMILGRLEIYTVLILFTRNFWRE